MEIGAVPAWMRAPPRAGNALLDRQYYVLYSLLQSAWEGIPAFDDRSFLGAFHQIVELAGRHCAAEEQLLAVNRYEWLEQHRDEHERGIRRLKFIAVRLAMAQIGRGEALAAAAKWFAMQFEDMDAPAAEFLLPGELGCPEEG